MFSTPKKLAQNSINICGLHIIILGFITMVVHLCWTELIDFCQNCKDVYNQKYYINYTICKPPSDLSINHFLCPSQSSWEPFFLLLILFALIAFFTLWHQRKYGWTWGKIGLMVLLALHLGLLFLGNSLQTVLVAFLKKEDGIFETIGAGSLLLTAVVAIYLFFKITIRWRWGFLFIGVLFLLGFLEEISWGFRWFSIDMNWLINQEILYNIVVSAFERDLTGEFNFHNLPIVEDTEVESIFWLLNFLGGFLVLNILIYKRIKIPLVQNLLDSIFHNQVLSLWSLGIFLCSSGYYLRGPMVEPKVRWLIYQEYFEELAELFFSVYILILFLYIGCFWLKKVRQ